jgi:uncharacterized protein YlaN (UPF0358 family)
MKKLLFKELNILSLQEKTARRIIFDRHRTIIKGQNETGKSSLLKSIYATFGADPTKIKSKWKQLNPITSVRFIVEETEYVILRINNNYSIFSNNNILVNTTSVTKDLAPFLANLLDFKIKIKNRDGNMATPTPPYMFLPFYIDQDESWTHNLSSFKYLNYLPNWKKDLINYSSGIRPNKYYELTGLLNENEKELKDINEKLTILTNTLITINENLSEEINLDIASFKEEIDEMLKECNILQNNQNKIRSELIELYNSKASTLDQIEVTKNAVKELDLDYEHSVKEITENVVDCPMCGAHYNNSFVERFELAKDADDCRNLLIKLEKELSDIEYKIEKEVNKLNENTTNINKINELLQTKKETVILEDMISLKGKNNLKQTVTDNIKIHEEKAELLKKIIEEYKEEINSLEDKKRKDTIKKSFVNYMKNSLNSLSLNSDNEESYSDMSADIRGSGGSELPRALLAYYYSTLNIMSEFSTFAYCPIVMDSPKQQDLDPENYKKVLTYIRDFQPKDSQLIIGLVDTDGIDMRGKLIELTDKYNLLKSSEYNSVMNELKKYIDLTTNL